MVISKNKLEPVEVKCPKCGRTEIIYLPNEDIPVCEKCRIRMVISELLDEGKST
jgi:ribosomal protein S27E